MPIVTKEDAPRIYQEDAIRLMAGILSRTAFFARLSADPGLAERLDRRVNPEKRRNAIHYDRKKVIRWIEQVASAHPRPSGPAENATNLGAHAARSAADSYGDRIADLVKARREGWITEEQFNRAVADLESGA